MVTIRAGTPHDQARIREFLETANLPTGDFDEAKPQFVVATAEDTDELVGTGALQLFGRVALLRSVAVVPRFHRSGLGRGIVAELERLAREAGVKDLVLLTTTAREFFERLGFAVIGRQSAPEEAQRSAEFSSLCPASAVCMSKYLSRAINSG
jgi:amino-acid N-acetyltransferase